MRTRQRLGFLLLATSLAVVGIATALLLYLTLAP